MASKTAPATKPSKTATKPAAKSDAKADAKAKPAAKEPEKPKAAAKPAAAPPPKSRPASDAKIEVKAAAPASRPADKKEEPMTLPRIPAAAPVVEERPAPVTTMSKTMLAKFRKLLEEKRDDIVKKAKQTLDEDMTLDANDLPDEMDLASSEYLQSFTFRLRGREKSFLDKIEKALARIDDASFGVCEECGEEISVKRLEARPETTLCIRCKEDQERAEKDFG